jgi:hypothetical protein
MTMSRKSISRVTLLLGLAVSSGGPAGAAHASTEPVGAQIAATAVQVLRLASSPAFRRLGPHYLPDDKSGRYRYEVTVHYRSGKFKKVVTYSNTPGAPRVLVDVIRKVENMPAPSFPQGFPFN